jgi:subtilisin-like proprotein convertase family protein
VNEITVNVDIEHSFIGDLQVELISPSGQFARLHNQEGWEQDNIKRSYDSQSTPALRDMIDEPIQGAWTLRVRDLAQADVGKLKRWSIKIG